MPPVLESLFARIPSDLPLEARTSLPTQTTNSLWTRILEIRQTTTTVIPNIIPTTYGSINSGPSPGTVVGIVLGSVAGFLLLLWLIYTCLNFGTVGAASTYTEEVVVARDRRKSHRGSHRGSHRSSRRHSEVSSLPSLPPPLSSFNLSASSRPSPKRNKRTLLKPSRSLTNRPSPADRRSPTRAHPRPHRARPFSQTGNHHRGGTP